MVIVTSINGDWRESARFCPSSCNLMESFSETVEDGWNRMTSGRPWGFPPHTHPHPHSHVHPRTLTLNYLKGEPIVLFEV